MHLALPTNAVCPVGQPVHDVCFVIFVKVFTAQLVQFSIADSELNSPGIHGRHAAWPSVSWKYPAGHETQSDSVLHSSILLVDAVGQLSKGCMYYGSDEHVELRPVASLGKPARK